MKILTAKLFISFERLEGIHMNFSGKMCLKIILKVTKTSLSLEDKFSEKQQGGQIDSLIVLGLKNRDFQGEMHLIISQRKLRKYFFCHIQTYIQLYFGSTSVLI